jgi:hypothetical protein
MDELFYPIKQCSRCKRLKSTKEFYFRGEAKDKLRSWCKQCTNEQGEHRRIAWTERNRDKLREKGRRRRPSDRKIEARLLRLRNIYNIEPEDFEAMLDRQHHRCAICNDHNPHNSNWNIDHDHACCSSSKKTCGSCIRGILCANCNRGLGAFKDNLKLLDAAKFYLISYMDRDIYQLSFKFE